jgi:hypothetical protein
LRGFDCCREMSSPTQSCMWGEGLPCMHRAPLHHTAPSVPCRPRMAANTFLRAPQSSVSQASQQLLGLPCEGRCGDSVSWSSLRSMCEKVPSIYCHVLVTRRRIWTGNWIY